MDMIGNAPEINDHQSQYVSWLATPEESRDQQGQSLSDDYLLGPPCLPVKRSRTMVVRVPRSHCCRGVLGESLILAARSRSRRLFASMSCSLSGDCVEE